ncbi:type II toxin-antitoxin system RelE/ParE family toxin [Ruegeria halocynthiae]|uniref:type II toxin-antitoxin system RelE/ParE family toxin n=1 Tax=Ruegeria halocynthiae TaxID=985054 RepID=UPI001F33ECC2|nr:type II toxin-antitoxin system RelE/ParE family toxin [Ruegeria halocynthiae]
MAEDSPKRASTFIEEISARFEPLLFHPEIGPARDQLSPNLRVQFHKKYAIYYTFTDTELIIVHVVHSARDAKAIFPDDCD